MGERLRNFQSMKYHSGLRRKASLPKFRKLLNVREHPSQVSLIATNPFPAQSKKWTERRLQQHLQLVQARTV